MKMKIRLYEILVKSYVEIWHIIVQIDFNGISTFFNSLYIYFITLRLVNGFTTAQKEPGHRSTVIEENTTKVYGH